MSKNLYEEHPFMIDSGTFWRCDHGETGYHYPCPECGKKHPVAYMKHVYDTGYLKRPEKDSE